MRLLVGLLSCLLCLLCAAEPTIFSKYSYRSNFTDEDLFASTFTREHLSLLRAETKHLFQYGFGQYMAHGFPYDEVQPVACQPNRRNKKTPYDTVRNDAMGNFSLTLLDNLDTFVVMDDQAGFERAVALVRQMYGRFDIDATIQVFETNIRILGGLLSAHLYASDPRRGHTIPGYDGFLLNLAYDLGKRLALAFDNGIGGLETENENSTSTSSADIVIPLPRTNLLKGPHAVPKTLQAEQCTAGVTSLVLEFGLLSRLSGDPIFEDLSRNTFLGIWHSRSKLDLLPMTIRTKNFVFSDHITGVGASVDSFYEYALKYAVLFDDEEFFQIWAASYRSLLMHSQNLQGIFRNVDVNTAAEATEWIDALGAFFPGLQVLAGDIDNAVLFHRAYLKIWNHYGAIPERWNFSPQRSQAYFSHLNRPWREGDTLEGLDSALTDELLLRNSVALEWYPLRPELIESSYYLYRATRDPLYLRVGEAYLERFRREFMAPCGFSGVLDVRLGTRQDRMESFVLGETLKYLYLLFDEANALNSNSQGNMVFSTEAHPMWFDRELVANYTHFNASQVVPEKRKNGTSASSGYLKGIFGTHVDYNAQLDASFADLKYMFYHHVRNDWREIVVNEPIRDKFLQWELGNFTVGQRALIDTKLERLLTPWLESEPLVGTLTLQQRGDSRYTANNDYLELDRCAVWQKSQQLAADPKFYQLDNVYAITLRHPEFLKNEPDLELQPAFYERYTAPALPQCRAETGNTVFEAVLSTGAAAQGAAMSRLRRAADGTSAGVYMADLAGFRAVFEKVKAGQIDHFGHVVTTERILNSSTSSRGKRMLNVLKINGYRLHDGESVWVNGSSRGLANSQGIEQAPDGTIMIDDIPVDNMRVW